jgi:hypothetical protein
MGGEKKKGRQCGGAGAVWVFLRERFGQKKRGQPNRAGSLPPAGRLELERMGFPTEAGWHVPPPVIRRAELLRG